MMRTRIQTEILESLTGKVKIHILYGPRHAGKTRFVRDLLDALPENGVISKYFSAESLAPLPPDWLEKCWMEALQGIDRERTVVLAFDEIQNVEKFRETIYRLFYEERAGGKRIHVLLPISASPLVSDLLAEWLVEEVETHLLTQWSFAECREAFGMNLDDYLFFGGYPGALTEWRREGGGESAWRDYLRDGVLEPVFGKDIHRFQTLSKPELFRKTAQLALISPCEVLSLNAFLDQLPEAGHAITISDYLKILQDTMLLEPLERYSGLGVRKRSSIPCLLVRDNGLVNALAGRGFEEAKASNNVWQSLTRNAIGNFLAREVKSLNDDIAYWKDGEHRVDFVATLSKKILAVCAQGRRSSENSGLKNFLKKFPEATSIAVSALGGDFSVEGFLNARMENVLEKSVHGWGSERFCAAK